MFSYFIFFGPIIGLVCLILRLKPNPDRPKRLVLREMWWPSEHYILKFEDYIIILFALFAVFLPVVIGIIGVLANNFYDDWYLNEHATYSIREIIAGITFTVIALGVAAWYWVRTNMHKADGFNRFLFMAAMLFLISGTCVKLMDSMQIHDMITLPADEITLYQPIRLDYRASGMRGCKKYLLIEVQEKDIQYCLYNTNEDQKCTKGINVQVHLLQNELGARILSVSCLLAPPGN